MRFYKSLVANNCLPLCNQWIPLCQQLTEYCLYIIFYIYIQPIFGLRNVHFFSKFGIMIWPYNALCRDFVKSILICRQIRFESCTSRCRLVGFLYEPATWRMGLIWCQKNCSEIVRLQHYNNLTLLVQGHMWDFRSCLVLNKSSIYKSKSKKNDLFCQTLPTYKSLQLISHKLIHPCLKLISQPF